MTRRYSLQIEAVEGSYSANFPELLAIVVTGSSTDEWTELAKEAVAGIGREIGWNRSETTQYHEIEVALAA